MCLVSVLSGNIFFPRPSPLSIPVTPLPIQFKRVDFQIVTKPTLAVIGESGPEAVIPLSRAGQMGGTTINLTVNAGVGTDGVQVGDDIVAALTSWSRQNGALPLSVSAA